MFEPVTPWVPNPSLALVEEAGIRSLPGNVHGGPGVFRYQQIPAEAGGLLVDKLVGKSKIGREVRPHPGVFRLVEWDDDAGSALWRRQMVTVDIELVLLRLAAENRVLIEHQHRCVRASLAIC